jgi:tetratricopeptide (TPR) repeat protein
MEYTYSKLAKNEFNKNNLDLALIYYKFDIYYNNYFKYLSYYNVGIIYFIKEKYQISLKYFKNSILLNPNWYKSWRMLGDVLDKLKLYTKAIIAYKRCQELSIFDDEINKKIQRINNKLISLEDTDSEQEEIISKQENIKDNKTFSYTKFQKTFYNNKIQKLLENNNLKNKILSSNGNPMVIFKDKDIYNLMNEMYTDYKKK